VNMQEPYERRLDRALPEFTPPASPATAPDALAVHRDPSIPQAITSGPDPVRPTVAWVRPSEVPTLIGARWVRRGIDLQTELTHRARRAPAAAATKAARRVTRPSIGRPQPSAPTATTSEGLGL
jgi:hypothetical protein